MTRTKKLIILYLVILGLLLLKIKFTHYNDQLSWPGILLYSAGGLVTWALGLYLRTSKVFIKNLVGNALCAFGFVLLWVPFWVAFFDH
jgi:putative effector of murein hydrolase